MLDTAQDGSIKVRIRPRLSNVWGHWSKLALVQVADPLVCLAWFVNCTQLGLPWLMTYHSMGPPSWSFLPSPFTFPQPPPQHPPRPQPRNTLLHPQLPPPPPEIFVITYSYYLTISFDRHYFQLHCLVEINTEYVASKKRHYTVLKLFCVCHLLRKMKLVAGSMTLKNHPTVHGECHRLSHILDWRICHMSGLLVVCVWTIGGGAACAMIGSQIIFSKQNSHGLFISWPALIVLRFRT